MTYTVSYGINTLSIFNSQSNYIITSTFIASGTSIVDTSFNLQVNYSNLPTNLSANYTITAIRIQ